MNIMEAIEHMALGQKVRNENFAAGTYCEMDRNGNIYDMELDVMTERQFLTEYKDYPENWYIYS